MSALRCVVFDLDGVLVTTDHFHYLGWKRLADELGMRFTETDNHLLRGISRDESLRTIYRVNNRALPPADEFSAQGSRKNGYYVEFIRQMTPADILPGAMELLADLRDRSIKRAIASSSRNAGLVLERTGLVALMDAVADGNDIAKSKPDPEVFLTAAAKAGVVPGDCVGIEDAAAGVDAIRAAGMRSIGIGTQAAHADLAVAHVRDVNADAILALHARR